MKNIIKTCAIFILLASPLTQTLTKEVPLSEKTLAELTQIRREREQQQIREMMRVQHEAQIREQEIVEGQILYTLLHAQPQMEEENRNPELLAVDTLEGFRL